MKISQKSTVAAISAIATLVGRAQAIGDCDNGPWKSHSVGYDTGGPWCATHWKDGAAINGVQAWYNGDSVNGIEFQYTNGAAPERYGSMVGDKKEWLQWDTTKEEVEAITVWPNGRSDVKRVAAIEIKISGREPWKAGNTPPKTQGYDSPVVKGAGIMMGAFGNQGGSIDMIGFLMLESGIKDRNIQDFNLNGDSLNANNEAIKNAKPESIESFSQENWTGENMEYSIDKEVSKSRSWSTTRSSSRTFGGSIGASIDFGLPAIGLGGSINTEFHWETTSSIETNESGTDDQKFQFSLSGKIPKGEALYCESLAFSGKYDLDYGSTINLELQSGQTWTYTEAGTVKGVAWSRNENKCISYGKGQSGPEVLQTKLAEWKENPEKEEEENAAREERAEKGSGKEEPTATSETSPTATGEATPTEADEATPTETDEAEPTETGEAEPTETGEAEPTETGDFTPINTDEPVPSNTAKAIPSKTAKATPSKTAKATPSKTAKATPTETSDATATETDEATPTATDDSTPTETDEPEATGDEDEGEGNDGGDTIEEGDEDVEGDDEELTDEDDEEVEEDDEGLEEDDSEGLEDEDDGELDDSEIEGDEEDGTEDEEDEENSTVDEGTEDAEDDTVDEGASEEKGTTIEVPAHLEKDLQEYLVKLLKAEATNGTDSNATETPESNERRAQVPSIPEIAGKRGIVFRS